MPREAIPFATPDLSAFARSLAHLLAERGETRPPSHVEWLNLIARAAGHRNLQVTGRDEPASNGNRSRFDAATIACAFSKLYERCLSL